MHAVVINVTLNEDEATVEHLRNEIVPQVAQSPGFVAGYWVRLSQTKGTSVIVYESEDAADGAKGRIQLAPGVTLDSAEVGEVVANA
jgi:hypothetical protein